MVAGGVAHQTSHHHTAYEAVKERRGNSGLVGPRQETVYADDWNID